MSATLRFTEKLEQINRFWIEKITKELEEKQKKENENILQKLGLDKMFQDMKKRNELFELMNEDDFEVGNKEIMKNVSKTKDIYNKTFDAMDNGNLKPLALKIFDNVKDEAKDTIKDEAKDSLYDYVGDKIQEAKKLNVGNEIEKVTKKLNSFNKISLIDLLEEKEVTSDKEKEKEKSKNRDRDRMRLRDR
ncbi:hypothetical protein NG783_10530 [Aliarcobacter cryaerophilus]|uniref:hypothetical protein n=1 Tax=Aliarcobacter cryaerophilus TaxID=28198 RepID=UPI003DA45C2C